MDGTCSMMANAGLANRVCGLNLKYLKPYNTKLKATVPGSEVWCNNERSECT